MRSVVEAGVDDDELGCGRRRRMTHLDAAEGEKVAVIESFAASTIPEWRCFPRFRTLYPQPFVLVLPRYSSMLQRACESDRDERGASKEAWNLQGWLSVGSHKLVQQTLRALVRGCSHPYAVRVLYG